MPATAGFHRAEVFCDGLRSAVFFWREGVNAGRHSPLFFIGRLGQLAWERAPLAKSTTGLSGNVGLRCVQHEPTEADYSSALT